MIVLKTYNKQDLETLIKSEEFSKFPFLPVSFHRAVSHTKNPRALENDTLLILAFEDEKLAGYIGVLPDDIFHQDKKFHIGWLSTLFVHPDFRGKKIAQKLLSKACEEYDNHILITEFTPEAENMYLKSGNFEYLNPLYGRTFYYRFNLKEILPAKKESYKKFQPLLRFTDFMGNAVLNLGYSVSSSDFKNVKITNKIDEETADFIRKNENHNSFSRNLEELSWFINYPWILHNSKKDSNEKREYLFSDYEPQFEYLILKIYDKDVLTDILILSVRNSTLKLHYWFGNSNSEKCAEVLHRYILKNKIICFICFHEKINHYLDTKFSLYKKERIRKFFIHKELKHRLDSEGFVFQAAAGDGDCIFF
ncbi:MAG: GNAT family N-acetyltransferase [Bergeyella sp.]